MLDVLILGGGPAGLSAAIYASRANLRYELLERETGGAGQITGASVVDNYPGLPGISGFQLGKALREHALSLGAVFRAGEAAGIERYADGPEGMPAYRVRLIGQAEPVETRTVLYAAGAEHVHLGIPGEDQLVGAGVCFCAVCDGMFFKDLPVAVIGGGNSALGDALYLSSVAEKVYLIHRRDSFRASPSVVDQVLRTPNIEPVLNAVPAAFEGEDMLEAIRLEDGRRLQVQGAFEAVGMRPRTELVAGLADLDEKGYVVADETGVTSSPGLFAAGDVRTKALRQAVTAASDGAVAIQSVTRYLHRT